MLRQEIVPYRANGGLRTQTPGYCPCRKAEGFSPGFQSDVVMSPATICPQCGVALEGDERLCPQCGALQFTACHPGTSTEPRHVRAGMLLEEAQRCLDDGHIERARQLAHEALTLRPDCPAIHSLLGCIQQKLGHESAARLHFKAALAVTPPSPATATRIVRPRANAWMAFVAFGCILFSGLATVFAFLPASSKTRSAALIHMQRARTPMQTPPAWTWQMPAPRQSSESKPSPIQDVSVVKVTTATTAHPIEPVKPPAPPAGTILGPAAQTPARMASAEPSLEKADLAYFNQDYDLAAMQYEALLRRGDATDPRIHQDLACCYQHLGNSGKATQHLHEALRGYQAALMDDPQNAAAQRGVAACQAALRELRRSREQATETP